MLAVISTHEMALSGAAKERLWKQFLTQGTTHSARAATLAYLIRRCEQDHVGYLLRALPGKGYRLEPLNKEG